MQPTDLAESGHFARYLPLREQAVKEIMLKAEPNGDPITSIVESTKTVTPVDELTAGIVVLDALTVPANRITSTFCVHDCGFASLG